jgi:hypothetical protein
MMRVFAFPAVTLLSLGFGIMVHALERPGPPPSRYVYSFKLDADSLPQGVKLREVKDAQGIRYFISNASEKPLIINERFQNEKLVTGTKLENGKTYQYFPNGVPMEGKTHLKGWQAPFGDIPETIVIFAKEPSKIADSRAPGLPAVVPEPEPYALPVKYDGKTHEIRGLIYYHLNPAYDEFYKKKSESN